MSMLVHPMRFATTRSRKRWFLSHHHSDATVDYPNLLILSWRNGYNGPKKPIRVLGPENHGALHLIFRDRDCSRKCWCSESPTPGTAASTRKLLEAYATDINDRMRDNAKQDLREIFDVADIEPPTGLGDEKARTDFTGNLVVGEDLMHFGIGKPRG
ncbi:hypothetical protein AB4Z09_07785 [Rhodococcus sp. TAF43]|uniref:hypothetical protein n=1 Tax=Rhodococcus sp. TAF43 TaxID=3237483 RepID=UPI003F973463